MVFEMYCNRITSPDKKREMQIFQNCANCYMIAIWQADFNGYRCMADAHVGTA